MEDPEIEKIKQKKLAEMLRQKESARADVVDLTSQNFDAEISKGLVLVDFWAEWCAPCRLMHPVFSRMAKKYRHIKFARLNVDAASEIAMRYGVAAIPTFILFKDGVAIQRMTGAVGEPGIHMIASKYQM